MISICSFFHPAFLLLLLFSDNIFDLWFFKGAVRAQGEAIFLCGRFFVFFFSQWATSACVYQTSLSFFFVSLSTFSALKMLCVCLYGCTYVHRVYGIYLFIYTHIHRDAHGWAAPSNHPRQGGMKWTRATFFFSYIWIYVYLGSALNHKMKHYR